MTANTRQEQMARELRRVLRLWLEGRGRAEYDQFCAAYLTRKGQRIAEQARAAMTDEDMERLAARAIRAGFV